MKVLLQTFVVIQHYSFLYQPKEKEVVAKDPPGKRACLMTNLVWRLECSDFNSKILLFIGPQKKTRKKKLLRVENNGCS